MTSTVIERTRQVHQDLSAQETALLDALIAPTATPKERLMQEHTAQQHLQAVREMEKTLLALYTDADGTRSRELEHISGDQSFSAFYEELRQLRDYFLTKASNVVAVNAIKSAATTVAAEGEAEQTEKTSPWNETTVSSLFTAEESYGRYVDMHLYFERYINLPQFKRVDYIEFLKTFDRVDKISRDNKLKSHQSEAYRKYIEDVVAYLQHFHQRLHPLVKTEKLVNMMDEEFDKLWNEKKVPGWFDVAGEVKQGDATTSAAADGMAPTPTTENKDQQNNPLYCKACSKQFAKESVFTAHLSGKAHKKAAAALASGTLDVKRKAASRSLALLEYRLQQWAELLRGHISDTVAHITEKQTKTYEEMVAEEERAAAEEQAKTVAEEDSDDDEEKPIYNPLNLPLGWDGKPIPFWLYKLHGLNIEYVCEICGNHSYYGPRNFERHFKEWRHAFGMRCLGIPNTKHFINVTKMDQAKALYEKLKKEWASSGFKPDEEEEFEDSEGNVFNKKTFQDLQRQGLI